jgi:hypothetical protein
MLISSSFGRGRRSRRQGLESRVILRGVGDGSGVEPISEIELELKRGDPGSAAQVAHCVEEAAVHNRIPRKSLRQGRSSRVRQEVEDISAMRTTSVLPTISWTKFEKRKITTLARSIALAASCSVGTSGILSIASLSSENMFGASSNWTRSGDAKHVGQPCGRRDRVEVSDLALRAMRRPSPARRLSERQDL